MTIKLVLTLELPKYLRWAGRRMIRRIHKWGTLYNPADSDVADMARQAGYGGTPCTVLSVGIEPWLEGELEAKRIFEMELHRLGQDHEKIQLIRDFILANYRDEVKAGEHSGLPHALDVALHYMKRERRLTDKRHVAGECGCGLYHTENSRLIGVSFRGAVGLGSRYLQTGDIVEGTSQTPVPDQFDPIGGAA